MFTKPNSKTITTAAVQVAGGIGGAKVSDGLVALLPEDMNPTTKGLIMAGIAIAGASCVKVTGTGSQLVQAAFVGMAIKQGADALTKNLSENTTPKEGTDKTARFVNAVLGHQAIPAIPSQEAALRRNALNSPGARFEPAYEYYDEHPAQEISFMGSPQLEAAFV